MLWKARLSRAVESCGSNALPLNWPNRFQSVMLKLVLIKDFIRCIKKFEWQSNVWIFLGVRRLPRGFLKATNTVTSRPFLQWKSQGSQVTFVLAREGILTFRESSLFELGTCLVGFLRKITRCVFVPMEGGKQTMRQDNSIKIRVYQRQRSWRGRKVALGSDFVSDI